MFLHLKIFLYATKDYYVIKIVYIKYPFFQDITYLSQVLFLIMNRLQNLNVQLTQSKYWQLVKDSKICPQEVRSLVYGPHYHYIQEIYRIIEKHQTIFNHSDIDDQTRKVERYHATRQMLTILKNYKLNDLKKDGYKFMFGLYGLVSYNLSLAIKTNIQYMLYLKTLITYGTTKLHQQYVQKAFNLQHLGCFALTQLHHGSYTKGIATEAIYNHEKKVFQLTTYGNKGMKFWIGASAQIANMAVIWAQVVVKGVSYGPHPFVVQVRDFKTYDLMPGVVIGDCGDKFGLNGIDNGYFILEGLIVPKQNLLNALGGIDQQGNYVSKVKSNQKRFGLHMSPLSSGRAALAYSSLACSTNALAIACKYVGQRRQFSNPSSKTGQQTLLIDYPLTKFRLIPLIAQSFIYFIGGLFITKVYLENVDIFTDSENQLVQQMHAFSAVLKSKSTWFANNVITQCRQLLGGHGYSSFSRLGRLFADNNIHSTWEGDNNMLLQQTSKYLIKCALTRSKCSLIDLEFIWQNGQPQINIQNLTCVENLERIHQKIIIDKLLEVKNKMQELKQKNNDPWSEWNSLQPHFCNGVSLSFGDYIYFKKAQEALKNTGHQETKEFLEKCLILWTLRTIEAERFGKYEFRIKVQQKILELCQSMTTDSFKFIESIKPPNFIIGSPFVKDEPMKQYVNLFMTGNNTFKRVDWFEKLVQLRNTQ